MSQELVVLGEFQGTAIQVRPSDQYIDVTAMCQANGREWHRYARLESAKRFQETLKSSLQKVEANGLVVQVGDGPVEKRHTFAHRRIALHCAAWISAEFEQWVYAKIEELMLTGRAEVQQKPRSSARMLLQMAQELVEQEERLAGVEQAVAVLTEERQLATAELRAIERSPDAAPPLSLRARVNQLVRSYCQARSADHREVWRKLYFELYYRCHFNAQLRAKKAGKPALEVVEEAGFMPDLYAIASELLVF